MKDILMLFMTCIALSLILSAVIGLIMFVVDIIRHGLPHEKATIQKSVDKYEERLAAKERELAQSVAEEIMNSNSPSKPLEL